MAAQDMTIHELVGKIERREIRLPEMQRRYVWKDRKVRDLLDSLYRQYPTGTILTWETNEDVVTRGMAVAQKDSGRDNFELLLDGQQRLTSLSAIMRGEPVHVRGRKRPIEILFNLDHPDKPEETMEVSDYDADVEDEGEAKADPNRMTFAVKDRKLANDPRWVSVTQFFIADDPSPFLERAGATSIRDEKYKKYSSRLAKLRRIRDYSYRVETLGRDLTYPEVTDIFVRVNSLGVRLPGSALAQAQITAKWPNSLRKFEEFEASCESKGFAIDLGTHIRNLVAVATGEGSFRNVGGLSRNKLETAWESTKEATEDALDFLRGCHVDSMALLSSPYLIIPLTLCRCLHKGQWSAQEVGKLAYWVHVASMKSRYSRGSSETILEQDLRAVKKQDIDQMLTGIRSQFGHLEVLPADLLGKRSNSPYYKAMFLAFRQAQARDWHTHQPVSLDNMQNKNKIQSHHIFPRAVLRAEDVPNEKVEDMCNRAFIGAKTNNQLIGKRPPHDYLLQLVNENGDGELQKQCIPTDPDLWQVVNYDRFLQKRRELIAKRLNAFLERIKSPSAS